MNWFNENRGWLVACVLSALAGALFVLWLKSSGSQFVTSSPVVDKPVPVQPKWDTVFVPKMAAIDMLTRPVPQPVPPETVYQQPSPKEPCAPFSLHLKSSPTSPSLVLDSVTLDYFYPSGLNTWQYWGARQSKNSTTPNRDIPLLSYGVYSEYLTHGSKLVLAGYGSLRLDYLTIQGGYRVEGNSHPSWFVGVRKEWKIF